MALAAMVTPEGAHGYSWSINKIMVYDVYRVEVGMEHDVSGTRLARASLAQVGYVLTMQAAELSRGWSAFW